ncbi:6-hydroxymethylpterin diphosphokinase MptE-like protein [Tissierella pigra]|uniref:Motility associated factor glycosyltransferase family protein n=1 Tax=Tissierella pigra TaxID=2607614 RepID=A0A6N7XHC8_9FIRM|nr:6-hydroxymethylpterin diphosphokinase MptE-like protein [Tissierella pigra]MSU00122.1 motility associated factor glycosyltransferase family protein [Tissierella pigra]
MILIDNINYLREKFPLVRERLKLVEENQSKQFQIEETRKGDKTLSYNKDDKKVYFHSKYDPIREAKTIIEEYKDIKDTNIIFYGTGLGYHIDLFVKENPNNNFYIFEPIEELMEKFLSIRNLSKSEYKDLRGISIGRDSIESDISSFLELNRKETIIVELPIHKQVFGEEFKTFSQIFLNVIKLKRSSIAIEYSFQRRWIINSMKNFREVLSTPNILVEKKGVFKNKPAILVAAGPSLNEEIENIRYIKENGLAYIFSVGSAINTLIHHNIYPDAATTYDPGEFNQNVFKRIKEEKISQIPMIFGSSVGFETLENYPGKKYHMITSQDKVANYYLEYSNGMEIDIVLDAPSIAVVTLQLLANLGFSPIILAGQNLGYMGRMKHSEGVYYSKDLTEQEVEEALWIEDVYGNKIKTNDGFNRMREQMELYITNMEKGRVINTTKGGAKINGTEFRELKNIIDNDLPQKSIIENWLDESKSNYNKKVLKDKVEAMDIALDEAYRWIKEYNRYLYKMLDLVKNRNFKQLDIMYNKLDISITALESNVFFTTFILQMNRVQHKLLADAVKISKLEKDLYKKHMDLLNSYKVFIDRCSNDMELIKPIYEEMKNDILKYIGDGEKNYAKQ